MKRPLIAAAVAALALAGAGFALWPGEQTRAPSAPGQQSAEGPQAARSLSERLDEAERQLERSDAGRGVVQGVVQDEAGQPVSGAQVTVAREVAGPLTEATCPVCSQPILDCPELQTAREVVVAARAGKAQPRLLGTATSGADGTFHFEDLPQDELILTAQKGATVGRVHYGPGDEPVLVLAPQTRLALKVGRLDDEETPLAGAHLTAISLDSFRVVEGLTDGSGQLRLDGLDEGSGVWVLAEAAGLLPRVATVYSEEEQTELWLDQARALVVRTAIGGRETEATVTLVGSSGHSITQTTRAGQVRFEALGNDSYEVTATTQTMVAQAQGVSLEQAVTTLQLELRAAAKLLVTVVDEAGEPVPEAEVSASSRSGEYRLGIATGGALAVLGPLGEGMVSVEVTSTDLRPWHREVDLHPGDNPLEVVLKKGVRIAGRVVDADGRPAAQAEVIYRPAAGSPSVGSSDEEGAFALVFDEPGDKELVASLAAVGKTTLTLSAPATGVVITLEPRARLKVFVHEGTAPIPGATVILVSALGEEAEADSVTGEDGVAIISGLPTGSYQLGVQESAHRQPPAAKVELIEGRTVALDVPLDRGLSLSGLVVDAHGAPVSGADVQTQPWTANASTDLQGRFTLTTLDPLESYELSASTELLSSAPISFKGPQAGLRLVLTPRPLVSGRVVDALTGAPLTTFEVDSRTIESADGRFAVPVSLAPDQAMTFTLAAAGFESLTWEGTMPDSREVGTLRLQKAKRIEGVVSDDRGNPVGGARVTCGFSEEVVTASDGSFRLELTVYDPEAEILAERGAQRGSARLELGRLIRIALAPPTRVVGQVVDAAGRPVAGTVTIGDGRGSDEVQVEAGADGAFVVELAPGRWVFTTRLSPVGQSFQVAGASTRVLLGEPPGSCSLSVQVSIAPDELLLLPGGAAPAIDATFEQLASIEGAVVFETWGRKRPLRASGFKCGSYTLIGRWVSLQRLQPVDVRPGAPALQLGVPPELDGALAQQRH